MVRKPSSVVSAARKSAWSFLRYCASFRLWFGARRELRDVVGAGGTGVGAAEGLEGSLVH